MAPNTSGERIQQLFLEAARLPADERDKWLRAHCDGDGQLLDDVRSLLEYDDLPVDPLESGPKYCGVAVSPVLRDAAKSPVVPGYKIIREIGTGGQAIVFEAVQESTTQRVALKMLRWGQMASGQERERLRREVLILARLSHPGIVSIIDCGETASGVFFIATEFVDGPSLDHLYEPAPSEVTQSAGSSQSEQRAHALRLFLKICDAVDAAHRSGVVHRDLKPANILIDGHGEPHVLDFGLAKPGIQKWFDTVHVKDITMSGQFMGSLPWASPEQAEGANVDARSDVYSLGVILYQLVAGGQFPYDVSGSMRDVITQIIHAHPTPLVQAVRATEQRPTGERRKVPLVDEELNAIVLKSLAKSRDERYQTAGEFAKAVGRYLDGHREVGSVGKEVVPAGNVEKRRNPRSALIAITASFAIVSVLFVVLRPFLGMESRDDPDSALKSQTAGAIESDWRSLDQELAKLRDDDSITKTSDGWRIRGREVQLPEMSSGATVLRAVLRRYSDKPVALRFHSQGGSEFTVNINRNNATNTDVIGVQMQGTTFVDGQSERLSSIGSAMEITVAILPDRISVANDGRLVMQLHCRPTGPWTPVLDAKSADIVCVDLQYSQRAFVPLKFAVDVVPTEMAAVDYVVRHGGAALSQPASSSTEVAKFHVSCLTTGSDGAALWASEVASIARCSKIARLRVANIAEPVEALAHIAKLKTLTILAISDSTLDDDCFHHLAKLDQLQSLILWRTQIRNPDFLPLQGHTALEDLEITSVSVNDEDLDQLASIKSLKKLFAQGAAVTSTGFRSLRNLNDLNWVELRSSQVSGDGVQCLSQLPNLWRLDISGSDVCDEDIPHLSHMSNLNRLTVRNTRLTAEGIDTLRRDLPKCTVVGDDR